MATVPYTTPNPSSSSFDLARRDDFFGYGNVMQAIDAITPRYTNPDGTTYQPNQVITTVSGGSIPPEMSLASSGGTFFDLRPPSEIFAELDARMNRQREQILNSPRLWDMLQRAPASAPPALTPQ